MGISHPIISLLMNEGKEHPFSGSVLQLGKQKILCDAQSLESMAGKMNYPLKRVEPSTNENISENPSSKPSEISDEYFFKSLGFSDVHALDVSDYEGADLIFDLNQREIPHALEERFDFIINSGTIEHVFHLPNALRNIFRMLKVGGRVIHIAPVNNYFEHGFYSFSPCFFLDYYHANQFQIIRSLLLRSHSDQTDRQSEVAECGPESPATQILGRAGALDSRLYEIFFVAEKSDESQSDFIPQQNQYVNIWEGSSLNVAPQPKGNNPLKTIYRFLIKLPGVGKQIIAMACRYNTWRFITWRRIP
jgi:SAM-dependent methyltransferase